MRYIAMEAFDYELCRWRLNSIPQEKPEAICNALHFRPELSASEPSFVKQNRYQTRPGFISNGRGEQLHVARNLRQFFETRDTELCPETHPAWVRLQGFPKQIDEFFSNLHMI